MRLASCHADYVAILPVEIIPVGDVSTESLEKAILKSNEVQRDFQFCLAGNELVEALRAHTFNRVQVSVLLEATRSVLERFGGFHPKVILVTDSFLDGRNYSNLFGAQNEDRSISIVSVCNLDGIFKEEQISAYLVYYFARWTLGYLVPEAKSHLDEKGCIFDKKIDKTAIKNSMKKRALCDECRFSVCGKGNRASACQKSSIEKLIELSGELLEEPVPAASSRKPRIFVGSSRESLCIARNICTQLEEDAELAVWDDPGIFRPGSSILEGLICATSSYDYAILVFSEDDEVKIRGESHWVPRDNVVFEAGLFMGQLGRSGVFIVKPKQSRILSDLNGISVLEFSDDEGRSLTSRLRSACEGIRGEISR